MKNISQFTLGAALAITTLMTLSLTIGQAKSDNRLGGNSGVTLTVPAKPKSTAYVMGTDQMYAYLRKGYQVQQVVDGANHNDDWHYFLMVKY